LEELYRSEVQLSRLHGPVGIYIDRTPPEIAVTIPAEVTAAKNGVSLPSILQVEGTKAVHETARLDKAIGNPIQQTPIQLPMTNCASRLLWSIKFTSSQALTTALTQGALLATSVHPQPWSFDRS
jgi:hypothetical protein